MVMVSGVTVRYSRRRGKALDEVEWGLREGKTLLLGPNGAGKSTLFKAVSGVLPAAAGDIYSPQHDGQVLIGYMPQTVSAIPGFSALEQVEYAAWLTGGPRRSVDDAREILAQVGLSDQASERGTNLSGGQLRRLGLAEVLISNPQVLLLDEPTAGLDPAERRRFRATLESIAVPTCVSTHQTDDAHDLYDWVSVLAWGRVIFDGSAAGFLALAADPTAASAWGDAYEQTVGASA